MLASLLSLHHSLAFGLTVILWLFLLLPITGSFVMALLKIPRLNFGAWIGISTGLSLALLMLLGLSVNTIGLMTHHPVLRTNILIPSFDIVFLGLLITTYLRKLTIPFPKFTRTKRKVSHIFLIHTPLLFLALSLIGTMQLNNGGANSFALINVFAIIIYEGTVILWRKPLSDYAYVINLMCVALSLIWSISMRSNYLVGFDIHQEFQVFSATLASGLWHPHLFNTTYNACLSITILPTVFKDFIPLSAAYIFKFFMQIILCIIPVCVYVIAKKQLKSSDSKLAFIAALFFVVQSQFITEFPALIRQQTAMLFFALIFVVILSKELSKIVQRSLILIFGVFMVVSHYSTAYVCLALLVLFVSLRPIYYIIAARLHSKESPTHESWHISTFLVAILLLFSFMWYAETLQETGGIVQKLSQSITNVDSLFSADSHSNFVVSTFHLGNLNYTTKTLQKLEHSEAASAGYAQPTYRSYTPTPLSPASPQINSHLQGYEYNLFNEIIPLIVKIVVVIGTLALIFLSLKGQVDIDNGLLVIVGGLLFALLAILPMISQDYNLERLYQQLLVVLSVAIVVGVQVICKRWKGLFLPLTTLIIIGYLICTTNLADQLLFQNSNINFDNYGATYDDTYTRTGEIDSLTWLSKQYAKNPMPISFDHYSTLDADAYTNIPAHDIRQGTFPSQFIKNGYVYASYTNLHTGITYGLSGSQVVNYNFPEGFLVIHKDTIYTSGDSNIYR